MMFVLGFVVGGVVVGFVANRKPEWFAGVVHTVNQMDAKMNAEVAKKV